MSEMSHSLPRGSGGGNVRCPLCRQQRLEFSRAAFGRNGSPGDSCAATKSGRFDRGKSARRLVTDMFSGFGKSHTRAWQNDPKFAELAGLCIDLYGAAVLLYDDVVTNRKAEASPFTRRLGRKERVNRKQLNICVAVKCRASGQHATFCTAAKSRIRNPIISAPISPAFSCRCRRNPQHR